ncbi:SGNH/GDSL hydrolase family protein [Pseudogracilibacillus sp. SE30717A]|uniref:SGNH/GDSL hydrolase family protein n=1 Tax=Pseudogracilibacillus sp. SE30717A TaxID=3098293 RepID=UPI00300DEE97
MKIALIGDSLTEGRPGVSFINILKEKLSYMTFVNLGNPGETVKSLYTRLLKTKLDSDYDLSFLWIGVNDVYSKLLSVQAQPVAKDHDEFKEYYEKVLELVLESSKKVVTVTPALVGENMNNTSNKEIKELNTLIQSITHKHANVSFLDVQSVFTSHLSKDITSDYISTKVMRVMMDVLFYKKTSRIDKLSKERGLHFTLDGIHLNSAGAQIVAEVYATEIKRLTNKSQDTIQ